MKKKYFLYDPENGFETFETEKECLEEAAKSIQYYLDDTWDESVTNIVTGLITHTSTQTDVEHKPDDLDEEGIAPNGSCWDYEYDYRCNYKMLPIVITNDDEHF